MKTVIVTGASDGLGLKISEKFAESGWKVVGLSRTKPKLDIKYIKVDLTKPDEINNAAEKIKTDYPSFDCLINCAGVLSIQDPNGIDYKEMEKLFKVNVLAPIKLVSDLFDNIKKNEADIVNIGSTVGFKAYENQTVYSSSKWALRGVTENLQLELKGTKCRVIGFNPGGFKSNFFKKANGEEKKLDTFMDPEYLASLLVYILGLPKQMEVSQIIINRK